MSERQFSVERAQIPVLGLGCSRIGSFNNPTPIAETRRLLERALELGVTLLDTADVYGQGDSEREVGRAVASRRDAAFVVTKVGKRFSTRMRLLAPLKSIIKPMLQMSGSARQAVTGRREGNMATDFSPAHIIAGAEASLRRLRLDQLDALLLHSPTAAALARPGIEEALASLKAAGKLRHYGVSCDDMVALEASLDMDGIDVLELPLDVIQAAVSTPAWTMIVSRSIAVIAREVVRMQPGVPAPQAVVRALAVPGVTSVVVGTSRVAHLEEVVQAVSTSVT